MMLKFFNSVNKLHKNMRVCFNLNYHNIRGHLGYMLLFMFVAVHTWHHILQNVLLCHLGLVHQKATPTIPSFLLLERRKIWYTMCTY